MSDVPAGPPGPSSAEPSSAGPSSAGPSSAESAATARPSFAEAPRYVARPPKHGRWFSWLVGACVLLLAAGAVVAYLLLRGASGAQTPQEAAETFRDALVNGDCDGLTKASTDEFAGSLPCDGGSSGLMISALSVLNVEAGDVTITDSQPTSATASFPVTVQGTRVVLSLDLTQSDGVWRVSGLNIPGGLGLGSLAGATSATP